MWAYSRRFPRVFGELLQNFLFQGIVFENTFTRPWFTQTLSSFHLVLMRLLLGHSLLPCLLTLESKNFTACMLVKFPAGISCIQLTSYGQIIELGTRGTKLLKTTGVWDPNCTNVQVSYYHQTWLHYHQHYAT